MVKVIPLIKIQKKMMGIPSKKIQKKMLHARNVGLGIMIAIVQKSGFAVTDVACGSTKCTAWHKKNS